MRVIFNILVLALACAGVAIADSAPAKDSAPKAGAVIVRATLDKTGARCSLAGVAAGGKGMQLSMQKLDASTDWQSTVETIDRGFRVTLNHKTLGNVRLLVAISTEGVITIQPGISEALPRLERIAKIAAGTDDTDEQIAKAKARVTEIDGSIDAENDAIKKEQSAIAAATIRYKRQRKRVNGPFVYIDDYLLPTGEAIVKESNDRIAASNKEIAKLNVERGQMSGQAVRLTDGAVGPELKKMPVGVLTAVNPLILTFDAAVALNKTTKVGAIELTLVAGAEGLKVAARPGVGDSGAVAVPAAAGKVYASLVEVVKEIPAGVMPNDPGGWTAVKVEVANEALKACTGGMLTTTLVIASDSIGKSGGKWMITAAAEERVGKNELTVKCTCPDTLKAQLAMCNVGDKVRVTGRITGALIDGDASNYPLGVSMDGVTELKRIAGAGAAAQPAAPLPVSPAPPKKAPPVANSSDTGAPAVDNKRGGQAGELFPEARPGERRK